MNYTVHYTIRTKAQPLRRQQRKSTREKSDMVTYEDSTQVVRKGELISTQTKWIQEPNLYLFRPR